MTAFRASRCAGVAIGLGSQVRGRRADDREDDTRQAGGHEGGFDERGVIAAAAMDQRGSLQKSLAKENGADVGDREMEEFKILVTEVLTPARQRDPARSRSGASPRASAARRAPGCCSPTRRPATTRHARPAARPARRLVGSPAQGSRAPTASRSCSTTRRPIPKTINDRKHAWVERIGDECRANDIPFFLEFIGYEEGARREGAGVREEEAGHRHRQHAGVHQGPLRRRRDEGRSARST